MSQKCHKNKTTHQINAPFILQKYPANCIIQFQYTDRTRSLKLTKQILEVPYWLSNLAETWNIRKLEKIPVYPAKIWVLGLKFVFKLNKRLIDCEVTYLCHFGHKYRAPDLSKSTGGEQPVEDIPNFTCICVCMAIFICVTPPGQTKNDTDLKFGTHTPIDLI